MLYRTAALLLLTPICAHAIDCDAVSPLKTSMGDEYYELQNEYRDTAKSPSLVKHAEVLLTSAKFDSGRAAKTVCKKIDGELTPVTQHYSLENAYHVTNTHGDIKLKLMMNNDDNRSKNIHTINIPATLSWQQGNTANTFKLNHRFRSIGAVNNGRRTQRVVELDIQLTVSDKHVNVTQLIYTNGFLAEQANWVLNHR